MHRIGKKAENKVPSHRKRMLFPYKKITKKNGDRFVYFFKGVKYLYEILS